MVTGSLVARSAGGVQIAAEEIDGIDEGYTHKHETVGDREQLEGHLLFKIAAQPKDTLVEVAGTLSTPKPDAIQLWPPGPSRAAPAPRVHLMRVWVAP